MRLTIILVAPARAENIGAAARAMKTMGFTQLRIVDSEAHRNPPRDGLRMARVILLIILTFFQR
jgi:tRNA C32,U32 (ribose-2'-O)-methylase TrmJ